MTNTDIQAIELPDIPRKYVKVQRHGERTFSASGPKADLAMRYLLAGGRTADQIAEAVECSVSRVREVMWCLDSAGIDYPHLARAPRNQTTAAPEPEVVEPEVVAVVEKPKRTRKPRAAKAEA